MTNRAPFPPKPRAASAVSRVISQPPAAPKPASEAIPFRTIKIQEPVHARLQNILAHVGQHGWAGIGSDRADRHTISAIIEEALIVLASRMRKQA